MAAARSPLTGISVFSGGGIGDLAMRAAGVRLEVACELLAERASVLQANYPEAHVFCGDVASLKNELIAVALKRLKGRPLDLLFATPPCQGMSKNGRGKLLSAVRAGKKPLLDPRNQLVFHAIDLALALRPRLVVFENVPEMEHTLIQDRNGQVRNVLDVIRDELAPTYLGRSEVVEFADYGVPQRRQRLITVFAREGEVRARAAAGGSLLPPRTHSKAGGGGRPRWTSVSEALRNVPSLDARTLQSASSPLPFHTVPVLDDRKYFWVSHTPPGKGAFDNQCVHAACGFDGNPTHGARRDERGINRANGDTPIRCARCGELLPRPWVVEGGRHRIMSGFTSAYKRMAGDLPASALTRNLSYACSDQKLHPTEHRVLSLHEAFILHTVADYAFTWRRADGRTLSKKTIREILGESIPPRGLQLIFEHLLAGLPTQAKTGWNRTSASTPASPSPAPNCA